MTKDQMPKNKINFKMRQVGRYAKYLSREDTLQGACVSWLQMQHKELLFCHPFNEGRRSEFERYRAKVVGMVAGVPDLLIFKPCDIYNGLAVEFKVDDNGLTPAQERFIEGLEKAGWRVEVCTNVDNFIETVETYLAL